MLFHQPQFSAFFCSARNPLKPLGVSYRGTAPAHKVRTSIPQPEPIPMVITSAHIQPIVALIAGIIILIMPRFLNLIVAIYLIFIGLVGLGLFKSFNM